MTSSANWLISMDMGRYSRSLLSSSVIPKLKDLIRRAETREFEPGLLSQVLAAYEADGCLDAGAADMILRKALEIAKTGDSNKNEKSGEVEAAWLDAFLLGRGYEDVDSYSHKQSSFHAPELSATARLLAALSESESGLCAAAAIRGYDLDRTWDYSAGWFQGDGRRGVNALEYIGLMLASGRYCRLCIREVPALAPWQLHEYDGLEDVTW